MKPTPCETCDNVTAATRDKTPHYWTCIKFPRLEGMNAVAPLTWAGRDPYNRCTQINLGACPIWTPRREPTPERDIQD